METTSSNKPMAKPHLPGYVVLGREKGSNSYKAIIEQSFFMDLSGEFACFFWSSNNATSNFGGKFKIDGLKNAEHNRDKFAKDSEMIFEIFDVHDDNIPIEIDWDYWRLCNEPANTLSGVKDKFGARNPRFKMK